LNLTQTGWKRKGESRTSPEKRQKIENRRDWLKCPLCDGKHPIKEAGQYYLAKPETVPSSWQEKNRDRIEAFKKKSK
jgi:hypothetical protein